MNHKILQRHLSWIQRGLGLEDILSIQEELRRSTGRTAIGTDIIQQKIGAAEAPENISDAALENLTYMVVEDDAFDGNLEFLQGAKNIQTLFISGRHSERKISDLNPLANLRKLNKISLAHHRISDLSPLSGLENLRDLDLQENRLRSIEPISGHRNILRARFSGVKEEELFSLLQHSTGALVSFSRPGPAEVFYEAFWVNGWAFKAGFVKEEQKVSLSIAPITGQDGKLPRMTAPKNLRALILKAREIAKGYMDEDQKIHNSEFRFEEKSNLLKGYFEFKLRSLLSSDIAEP